MTQATIKQKNLRAFFFYQKNLGTIQKKIVFANEKSKRGKEI